MLNPSGLRNQFYGRFYKLMSYWYILLSSISRVLLLIASVLILNAQVNWRTNDDPTPPTLMSPGPIKTQRFQHTKMCDIACDIGRFWIKTLQFQHTKSIKTDTKSTIVTGVTWADFGYGSKHKKFNIQEKSINWQEICKCHTCDICGFQIKTLQCQHAKQSKNPK